MSNTEYINVFVAWFKCTYYFIIYLFILFFFFAYRTFFQETGDANFHTCYTLAQGVDWEAYISLQSDIKNAEWELNLVGFVGYVCALNMKNYLNEPS